MSIERAIARIDAYLTRTDAEFREADHPRAEDGRFGTKAGASKSPASAPPSGKVSSTKARVSAPVAKAIGSKPKSEATYHATSEAWNHAPQVIIDAIANIKPLKNAVLAPDSGAYYMPETHSISINKEPNPSDRHAVLVWQHEFGHAIDFNGKRPPASAACVTQLNADGKSVEKIKEVYLTAMNTKFGGNGDPDYRLNDGLMLSDFVCALTDSAAGYGHSKEYFSNTTTRLSEMFANYVALSSGKNGEDFRGLLHRIAPECCASFDAILDKKGKKWWQN